MKKHINARNIICIIILIIFMICMFYVRFRQNEAAKAYAIEHGIYLSPKDLD